MNEKCACCGHVFTMTPIIGAFNQFRGEPRADSSLFGSHHVLCMFCSENEEAYIEAEGTNDIPALLATYENGVRQF
jgi:hypothetical protein